jgi:hypothetical protein
MKRFPRCAFLSLGAGAGGDVLQALSYGAAEIHAVEVIPHVNRMMTVDDTRGYTKAIPLPPPPAKPAAAGAPVPTPLPTATPKPVNNEPERLVSLAEFSGFIYRDPRVRVVTEDARAYVGRFENHFDIIYSLSSNSFAALASGSFALAENYLFTTEAFSDYWKALTPGGFMIFEHQFFGRGWSPARSTLCARRELLIPPGTSRSTTYRKPGAT